LGKVPATIILSFATMKMWLIGMAYYLFIPDFLLAFVPAPVSWILIMGISVVLSLYLTGLSTRPLRDSFELKTVTDSVSLIGEMCLITSGKVTQSYGTAEIARSEGASFLLNVICKTDNDLKRDREAIIVDYDKVNNIYSVRPMEY
jgi:hypothetical protein